MTRVPDSAAEPIPVFEADKKQGYSVEYKATSLEAIAREFDDRAKKYRAHAQSAKTLRDRRTYTDCAFTWEQAAEFLRCTKLVDTQAAAPELLAALEFAMDACAFDSDGYRMAHSLSDEQLKRRWDVAAAAASKARGEA